MWPCVVVAALLVVVTAQKQLSDVPCRANTSSTHSVVLSTECDAACGRRTLCVYYYPHTTDPLRTQTHNGVTQSTWRMGATCAYECLAPTNGTDVRVWSITWAATDQRDVVERGAILNASQVTASEMLTLPPSVKTVILRGTEPTTMTLQVPERFLESFENVTTLEASSIRLSGHVYAHTPKLPHLQSLVLRSNALVCGSTNSSWVLPIARHKLTSLQHLDVSDNAALFSTVVDQHAIQFPTSLVDLALRNTGLHTVPTAIRSLRNLKTLDLSANALESIPSQHLPLSLASLSLANCSLTTMPDDVHTLAALKVLDLSDNPLQADQVDVLAHGVPTHVQTLLLTSTNLVRVPTGLHQLGDLRTLSLASNPLGDTQIDVQSMLPRNLRSLDLSDAELTSIPSNLRTLTSLHTLKLAGNTLETLPLEALPSQLTTLTLSHVQDPLIEKGTLPTSLVSLTFTKSNFVALPPDLIDCLALQFLNLSHNQLEQLETPISTWPALTTLDLSDNALTEFRAPLLPLPLTTLVLASNGLVTFEIGNHTQLTTLDLRTNGLTVLPPSIFGLTALQQLRLEQNPLRNLVVSYDQFTFLASLRELTIDPGAFVLEDGEYTCESDHDGAWRTAQGHAMCVRALGFTTTAAQHKGSNSGSRGVLDPPIIIKSKSSWLLITGNIVLTVLLITVLIMGAVVLHKRRITVRHMFRTVSKRSLRNLRRFASGLGDDQSTQRGPDDAIDRLDDEDSIKGELKKRALASNWERLLLPHRIHGSLITRQRQLATGMFGEVWLAHLEGNASMPLVAIKQLKPECAVAGEALERFVTETQLLSCLVHVRIVTFVGVSWTRPTDLQLVLEYAVNGDLRSHLDATTSDSIRSLDWSNDEAILIRIALEICEALVYLHSLDPKIIHRDLKSRNVLLDQDFHAKICDFGCARKYYGRDSLEPGRTRSMGDDSDESYGSSSAMTGGIGTIRWIAPEVLTGTIYDESVDIYSLGMILSELITGELPYHHIQDDHHRTLPDTVLASLLVSGKVTSFTESFTSSGGKTLSHLGSDPISEPTGSGSPRGGTGTTAEVARLLDQCASLQAQDRPSAVQVAYELRQILARVEMSQEKQTLPEHGDLAGDRHSMEEEEEEKIDEIDCEIVSAMAPTLR